MMWSSQTLVQLKRALTATLVFSVIATTLFDEVADHRGTNVSSGGVSGRRLRSLADVNTTTPTSLGQMNKYLKVQKQQNPREQAPGISYIVLLTGSYGFLDMFLNWLKFFERLDIHDLPVYMFAEDKAMYNKCVQLVESLEYQAVDMTCLPWHMIFDPDTEQNELGAARWRSSEYYEVVSRRPAIIQHMLELGYNIIYADLDAIWMKNPLPIIQEHLHSGTKRERHILAQKDDTGDPNGQLCTGFTVYRSHPATISLVSLWRQRLEAKPGLNQGIFNSLLRKIASKELDIDVRAESLPVELFANGRLYFSKMTEGDRQKVIIAHNNFISGYDNKIARFKKFGLWLVD